MDKCLFCEIAAGITPGHRIYEDNEYLALLDIFPSVRGQAIVFPRKHFGSYLFEMDPTDYLNLMSATYRVAQLMDGVLGALRTCMVMEGMEVDHAHIKLYPIYEVLKTTAEETIDLNKYPGYLSTQHGKRMTEAELAEVAHKFRQSNSH